MRKRKMPVLAELQARRTADEEIAVAVRLGAEGVGSAGVLTVLSLEYEDNPEAACDLMR
jgi:hypothetical protein